MTKESELAAVLAQLAHLLVNDQPEVVEMRPPQSAPAPVLLTVGEAAKRLRLGKTKTYALVKSGELESVLIGRLRRIHIDSVHAYAARLVAEQQARQPVSRIGGTRNAA
jgi:excisionase family DNA binding protein